MPQFSDDLFLGSAQTFMGTGNQSTENVVYGSISGTTLTVTQMLAGDPITVGSFVGSSTISAGTQITGFLTGSGGTGTYTVSISQSVVAGNIFLSNNGAYQDPSPMDLGVGPLGRTYIFDVIPQAIVTNNIALSQTPAAAGNLTLTPTSSAYFLSVNSVVRSNGTTVTQLDCPRAVTVTTGAATGAMASVAVTGTAGQISFTATTGIVVGQAVVVTGTNSGSSTGIAAGTYYVVATNGTSTATLSATVGGAGVTTTAGTTTGLTFTAGLAAQVFTVSGYDYYGQAMTEQITSSIAASTGVVGKKAFYQIASVAVAGATGGAVLVGTSDVIGLPVRVVDAGYLFSVQYGNSLASANLGTFVAAVTTTATSTTGDVRGTYKPATATNGYSRIVICVGLNGIQVGPNATRTGALGVTQA